MQSNEWREESIIGLGYSVSAPIEKIEEGDKSRAYTDAKTGDDSWSPNQILLKIEYNRHRRNSALVGAQSSINYDMLPAHGIIFVAILIFFICTAVISSKLGKSF